jgi:N-acetylglutamate synthase-like GNAT family acetyltransferase
MTTLRTATLEDAFAIHALIVEHLAEGHLLPRELDEIALHINRFVVAVDDDTVIACGELAPLSRDVSEVRSLVVSGDARSRGLGQAIVDELVDRAARAGFQKLCAFTHAPAYFVQLGFSIVPHVWLPEKIVANCHNCPHFRQCGQYAVVHPLHAAVPAGAATDRNTLASLKRGDFVPLAALHA